MDKILSVTVEMKLLSNTLLRYCLLCGYSAVQAYFYFESVNEILKCDHSNETLLSTECFPVVLLGGCSMDEMLKCGHSNESQFSNLSFGAVCFQ